MTSRHAVLTKHYKPVLLRAALGKPILNTKEIDFENLELVGDGAEYALYADDGVCREYGPDRLRVVRR